jgi:hypothetical protein
MDLADIIFERIPPAMLERVVYDQGVLDHEQFTSLFKTSGFSNGRTIRDVVEGVVAGYAGNAPKLAAGLYHQISLTEWETAKFLYQHFSGSAELQYDNHQASLVGRYPALPVNEFSDFINLVKRRVCLIICRKGQARPRVGTGFLVAPDLVLTSRHVLADFDPLDDITANGNQIELLFDFFQGDPVAAIPVNVPDGRKVHLSKQWHVASCNGIYPGGRVINLSPTEQAQLSHALDYILLRLEDRIGLQSIDKGGGQRRGWIELPQDATNVMPPDEWIIIPQHPNGVAQRIDLGRFLELDDTQTRLRYNTNTAPGTSGAPCFDHSFNLVGIHNAQVGPGTRAWANEAISFDKIDAAVRPCVQSAISNLPPALRWSIARDNDPPEVVLGRERLLGWLAKSARSNTVALRERVYVAVADQPGAGCTFSIDLLEAETRNSRTPRVVFGARGQQLPATAEDFLRAVLREMDIVLDQNDAIPIRPTTGKEAIAGEIDKLERWLSNELPNWLGATIQRNAERLIDGRIGAKAALSYYLQSGQTPPVEVLNGANALEPYYVRANAWDFAYIVIDDLRGVNYQGTGPRTELKGEVMSLIAALVKGKGEEVMHSGLRRLRWMFLGFLPDFLSPDSAVVDGTTLERLDPLAAGKMEVAAVVDRMWEALLPKVPLVPIIIGANARFIVSEADQMGGTDPRLKRIQRKTNEWASDLLGEIRS